MKLILARDSGKMIGNKGGLPWPTIKEDMKWFRKATKGKTVVMGSATFESFDHNILQDRYNIVITQDPSKYDWFDNKDCEFMTINQFMKSEYPKSGSTWLIGGAKLATTLMPYVTEAYITEVDGYYKGDTMFEFDFLEHGFEKASSEKLAENAVLRKWWRKL